jgi:hypothetical protein
MLKYVTVDELVPGDLLTGTWKDGLLNPTPSIKSKAWVNAMVISKCSFITTLRGNFSYDVYVITLFLQNHHIVTIHRNKEEQIEIYAHD